MILEGKLTVMSCIINISMCARTDLFSKICDDDDDCFVINKINAGDPSESNSSLNFQTYISKQYFFILNYFEV